MAVPGATAQSLWPMLRRAETPTPCMGGLPARHTGQSPVGAVAKGGVGQEARWMTSLRASWKVGAAFPFSRAEAGADCACTDASFSFSMPFKDPGTSLWPSVGWLSAACLTPIFLRLRLDVLFHCWLSRSFLGRAADELNRAGRTWWAIIHGAGVAAMLLLPTSLRHSLRHFSDAPGSAPSHPQPRPPQP